MVWERELCKMQKMIDFSGASKVQESLKASLMARYDERKKTMLEDADLDVVAAAAPGDWMSDYIGKKRFKK